MRDGESVPHNIGSIMSTPTPSFLPTASLAASTTLDAVNDWRADAARYAVLNRMMPALRHDVAGAMQPVRMLLMVLERRLQNVDPDLDVIAKNVTSISMLTKEASVEVMSAMGWTGSGEDVRVSLRSSVDETIKLLALELTLKKMALVNGIADDSATAPQSFLRSVFMGALLAFCDQDIEGGMLRVTFDAGADNQRPGQLQVRMLPDDTGKSHASLDVDRKYRKIAWPDVQAMAQSCGVAMVRGDGWLTLDLPKN